MWIAQSQWSRSDLESNDVSEEAQMEWKICEDFTKNCISFFSIVGHVSTIADDVAVSCYILYSWRWPEFTSFLDPFQREGCFFSGVWMIPLWPSHFLLAVGCIFQYIIGGMRSSFFDISDFFSDLN